MLRVANDIVGNSYDRPRISVVAASPLDVGVPLTQRIQRQRRAPIRRDTFARNWQQLHGGVEFRFLQRQKRFWRELRQYLGRRIEIVGPDLRALFQPDDWRTDFDDSMRPAWALALDQGMVSEEQWTSILRDQRQSFKATITQSLDEPLPTFDVEMSPFLRERVRAFLRSRAVGVWNVVSKTIAKKLALTLRDGLRDGLNPVEMKNAVIGAVGEMEDYAAKRIARTETTSAMNHGQQLYREEIEMTDKEWISTLDMRTRGASVGDRFNHLRPDGDTVPNNGLFLVSGERMAYPGDGANGASAGNIINCRCAAATAFPDEPLGPGVRR